MEPGVSPISEEDLAVIAEKHPEKAFFITMGTRPGVKEWSQEFEYAFYQPGTKLNDLFDLMLVKWPKDPFEQLWFVLAVPLADAGKVMKIGEKWRLTFAKNVAPVMIGGGGTQFFPVRPKDNVYTVEGGYRDFHVSLSRKKG